MAKSKQTSPPSQTETEPAKKRNRRQFLLLVRANEKEEWEQLVTLSNQKDCKSVADMIRNLLASHKVSTDGWQFSARIVGHATDTF